MYWKRDVEVYVNGKLYERRKYSSIKQGKVSIVVEERMPAVGVMLGVDPEACSLKMFAIEVKRWVNPERLVASLVSEEVYWEEGRLYLRGD